MRLGITLSIDIAEDIPCVTADRTQIQQVLLNLILNAVDAYELSSQRSQEIYVSALLNDNAEILISVQDQGRGVAPNIADQIFAPPFHYLAWQGRRRPVRLSQHRRSTRRRDLACTSEPRRRKVQFHSSGGRCY